MLRVSDLRHKDIINIADGRRLGYIRDVDIDLLAGQIKAVVVPGEANFFSFFSRGDDMVIPWRQIKRIGVDVILVELEHTAPARRFSRRHEAEQEDAEESRPSFNSLPVGAMPPLDYESRALK